MATLCRFENRASRQVVRKIQRELVEQFIRTYEKAPKEVVLDFDATDSGTGARSDGITTDTMVITVSYRCTCTVGRSWW